MSAARVLAEIELEQERRSVQRMRARVVDMALEAIDSGDIGAMRKALWKVAASAAFGDEELSRKVMRHG